MSNAPTGIARKLQESFRDFLHESAEMFGEYGFLGDCERHLRELEAGIVRPFNVAVFGRMKTGKSSLINALLGKDLAIKHSRFGTFIGCTGYPECKFTKPIVKKIDVKCPTCGGDIIIRRGKSGKMFYGCSNYPSCNQVYWDKPSGKLCPECGSMLVEKKSKDGGLVCSNKECNYKE